MEQKTISLQMLLDFNIQKTYQDISVLSEILLRKNDFERKMDILFFADNARKTYIRLLKIIEWAENYEYDRKYRKILEFIENQSRIFIDSADFLSILSRETLYNARLNKYRIFEAVNVITEGKYIHIPNVVRDKTCSIPTLTVAERAFLNKQLNFYINCKLLTDGLPKLFAVKSFGNGKLRLWNETDRYMLELTLQLDTKEDNEHQTIKTSPWICLSFNMIPNVLDEGQQIYMKHLVDTKLALVQDLGNISPLNSISQLLHAFCLGLKIESYFLSIQKQQFALQDNLIPFNIVRYLPNQCISLAYWTNVGISVKENDPKLSRTAYVNPFTYYLDISIDRCDKDTTDKNWPIDINDYELIIKHYPTQYHDEIGGLHKIVELDEKLCNMFQKSLPENEYTNNRLDRNVITKETLSQILENVIYQRTIQKLYGLHIAFLLSKKRFGLKNIRIDFQTNCMSIKIPVLKVFDYHITDNTMDEPIYHITVDKLQGHLVIHPLAYTTDMYHDLIPLLQKDLNSKMDTLLFYAYYSHEPTFMTKVWQGRALNALYDLLSTISTIHKTLKYYAFMDILTQQLSHLSLYIDLTYNTELHHYNQDKSLLRTFYMTERKDKTKNTQIELATLDKRNDLILLYNFTRHKSYNMFIHINLDNSTTNSIRSFFVYNCPKTSKTNNQILMPIVQKKTNLPLATIKYVSSLPHDIVKFDSLIPLSELWAKLSHTFTNLSHIPANILLQNNCNMEIVESRIIKSGTINDIISKANSCSFEFSLQLLFARTKIANKILSLPLPYITVLGKHNLTHYYINNYEVVKAQLYLQGKTARYWFVMLELDHLPHVKNRSDLSFDNPNSVIQKENDISFSQYRTSPLKNHIYLQYFTIPYHNFERIADAFYQDLQNLSFFNALLTAMSKELYPYIHFYNYKKLLLNLLNNPASMKETKSVACTLLLTFNVIFSSSIPLHTNKNLGQDSTQIPAKKDSNENICVTDIINVGIICTCQTTSNNLATKPNQNCYHNLFVNDSLRRLIQMYAKKLITNVEDCKQFIERLFINLKRLILLFETKIMEPFINVPESLILFHSFNNIHINYKNTFILSIELYDEISWDTLEQALNFNVKISDYYSSTLTPLKFNQDTVTSTMKIKPLLFFKEYYIRQYGVVVSECFENVRQSFYANINYLKSFPISSPTHLNSFQQFLEINNMAHIFCTTMENENNMNVNWSKFTSKTTFPLYSNDASNENLIISAKSLINNISFVLSLDDNRNIDKISLNTNLDVYYDGILQRFWNFYINDPQNNMQNVIPSLIKSVVTLLASCPINLLLDYLKLVELDTNIYDSKYGTLSYGNYPDPITVNINNNVKNSIPHNTIKDCTSNFVMNLTIKPNLPLFAPVGTSALRIKNGKMFFLMEVSRTEYILTGNTPTSQSTKIVIPIFYDMTHNVTHLADLPMLKNCSAFTPLQHTLYTNIDNTLRSYVEYHNNNMPNQCSLYPAIQEMLRNY